MTRAIIPPHSRCGDPSGTPGSRLPRADREEVAGPNDLSVAAAATNLAMVRQTQGGLPDAEKLYRRAPQIREKALAPNHLEVARTLELYAGLLFQMKREKEGAKMQQRASSMRGSQPAKP